MIKNNSEYKVLTSIWVLSCNDKVPQMTYQGILERVEIPKGTDIRKLIKKFPELFQEKIPQKHFLEWKSEMLNEVNRPKWIANSDSQKKTISELIIEDVFRNRFRNSIDSEANNTDILKWGLEYLKDHFVINKNKTELIWTRIFTILIPLLSIIVAGISVYSSSSNNKNLIEFERKKTEREIILPSYHRFLNSINNSVINSYVNKDYEYTANEISKTRTAFFELNPFLDSLEYSKIKLQLNEYHYLILKEKDLDSLTSKEMDSVNILYTDIIKNLNKSISEKLNTDDNN